MKLKAKIIKIFLEHIRRTVNSINELSDTSKNLLADFWIATLMDVMEVDGQVDDEELDAFFTILNRVRDWMNEDHPAISIAQILNRRVDSAEDYFMKLPRAQALVEKVRTVLSSIDVEEQNYYCSAIVNGAKTIAEMDGKRDLRENAFILDLFGSLNWDFQEMLEDD